MKFAYIIIFDSLKEKENPNSFIDRKDYHELIEKVRSSYISKQLRKNIMVIVSDKRSEPRAIYENLFGRKEPSNNVMVIPLDSFYGNFLTNEVSNWLKTQLPNRKWINPEDLDSNAPNK